MLDEIGPELALAADTSPVDKKWEKLFDATLLVPNKSAREIGITAITGLATKSGPYVPITAFESLPLLTNSMYFILCTEWLLHSISIM